MGEIQEKQEQLEKLRELQSTSPNKESFTELYRDYKGSDER